MTKQNLSFTFLFTKIFIFILKYLCKQKFYTVQEMLFRPPVDPYSSAKFIKMEIIVFDLILLFAYYLERQNDPSLRKSLRNFFLKNVTYFKF